MRSTPLALLLIVGCSSAPATTADAGEAPPSDAAPEIDAGPISDAGTLGPGPHPPPPWDPPIPLDPEVGWRESTEPLCSPFAGEAVARGVDLFADDRGVFVLAAIDNDPFSGGPTWDDGLTVQHNDGTGWEIWHELAGEPGSAGAHHLSGVPGGPLFLWPGGCPIQRIEGAGSASCAYDESAVGAAFFASESLAYLAVDSPPAFVRLEGEARTTIAALDPSWDHRAIWGDAEDFVALLSDGVLRAQGGGELARVPGAPAAEYTAMFALSADDLWLGTADARLVHFDGGSWETIETGLSESIAGLWSDGSVVYFATWRGFGRYDAEGGVDVVFEYDPDEGPVVGSITGHAGRGEVYLGLVEPRFDRYECGPVMLIVYDGERLRRF